MLASSNLDLDDESNVCLDIVNQLLDYGKNVYIKDIDIRLKINNFSLTYI